MARVPWQQIWLHALLQLQFQHPDVPIHRMSEPFANLAPVDVELLLGMGVPKEAIINGTRLDLAMLEDLGWIVEPGSVSPPLVEN